MNPSFHKKFLVIFLAILSFQTTVAKDNILSLLTEDVEDLCKKAPNSTKCALGHKLLTWEKCREVSFDLNFQEIANFVEKNPGWPDHALLIFHAEEEMTSSIGDKTILKWFRKYSPRTMKGLTLYAEALTRTGKKTQAINLVKKFWHEKRLSKSESTAFYKRFKRTLNTTDHYKRFLRMVWIRDLQTARRLVSLLPRNETHFARALIALSTNSKHASKFLQKVPLKMRTDPNILFQRVKWRRMRKDSDGAWELLKIAPKRVSYTKHWWQERHILARRAIRDQDYKKAYKIVNGHTLRPGGPDYAEAEWLAGWLNLKHLHNLKLAEKHFSNFYRHVSTSISRAKAHYWLYRTYLAQKKKSLAQQHLRNAGAYQSSFYGQLAIEIMNKTYNENAQHFTSKLKNVEAFRKKDLTQVVEMLINFEKEEYVPLIKLFIKSLHYQARTPGQRNLLIEYADKAQSEFLLVYTARLTRRKGPLLNMDVYPVFEKAFKLGDHGALIHAIIRQESSFDQKAISPAGARGLMQLMPRTARQTARALKRSFKVHFLLSNPMYNITLGAKHLESLIKKFDGSYVLAIAAYNAGAHKVKKWIKYFGDPRTGSIDTIDWIEQIPYSETRSYVHRVLENLQLYRVKFKEDFNKTNLLKDLHT